MPRVLYVIFIGFFFFIVAQAEAQPVDGQSGNRRARRAFDKAMEAYHGAEYDMVLKETERAISLDPGFLNALMLQGVVLNALGRFEKSAETFRKLIAIDKDIYPQAHFYNGTALLKSGAYGDAERAFKTFLTYEGLNAEIIDHAVRSLANCRFALDAMNNPVPFEPINLGEGVNSKDAEYSPALTADGQTLVFTRRSARSHMAPTPGQEVENFFVSHFDGSRWSKARDVGPPINTSGNEGAQCLSADGRELFFTACNRSDGLGSCDIYYAQRTGTHWSTPVNLGPDVNTRYWESQPTISSDGRSLYFSSARPGSYGEMDLWVATRDENGQWQDVANLGPVINTSGREMSPFIHPDNQTLYFASDGHAGMGGVDLFLSRRDEQGQWSKPENMGYPLNTHADEFSLVVGASGEMAYFATDKPGGFGNMDIYEFELYKEARPQPVTYMKGKVFDKDTGKALDASFELIDLAAGHNLHRAYSDPLLGDFLVVVPVNVNMALNVSSPGYLFFSEHFSIHDARDIHDPYLIDIGLQALRSGESVVLKNVFFDTGSYELKPESHVELGKLLAFLETHTNISVEISGHTDNVGTFEYNRNLSENRARSVVEFLVASGIDPHRISHQGYADTKPVDTNDTEEGRANNRRTECTVTDQ